MSLTKVSFSMIDAAPVNAADFGVVGDGVTPDADALQAAIDFCLVNKRDLYVDGLCFLEKSVNIDKPNNDPTYDSYFTIYSSSGGGFIVDDDIAMFSSSIPFSTAPVVALVRFDNLLFESKNTLHNAYVLDDARFLRTVFSGCSFSKIKCLSASTVIIQSIYFLQCNVRRFTGTFFNSGAFTYDFKFVECLVEAGSGTALRLKNAIGCAVVGSCIEGMSGTAIAYNGSQGLDVTGCYFEANDLDIDGTDGGTSASVAYGVCLNGNYFSHPDTTYSVVWGQSRGCVSVGNYHQQNMHDITDTASLPYMMFFDSATGIVANAPINDIRGGYDGNYLGTYTGLTSPSTATIYYNKTGNTVTLRIPSHTGTSNSTSMTITGMPASIWPTQQQACVLRVVDNNVTQLGIAIVDETNGNLVFGVGGGSAFTNSGTKGTSVCTITYSLT